MYVYLYKSIAANNVIPVSFRMRQARSTVWRLCVSSSPDGYCLDCKRTSGNQENNAVLFDHCNLTNMQVGLNHSRYPAVDMATDFAKGQYAGVYKSFYDFVSRY